MKNNIFQVEPAPFFTYLTILGIFVIMLVPFVALSLSCYRDLKNSQFSPFVFIGIAGLVIIIAVSALFAYFGYSARNTRFVLTNDGLRIKGCFYGRTIPKDLLVAQDVQILDLVHDKTHSPKIRRNGVGLPGYLEGWFKLKSGEKALLFLTNKEKAVYIPTNNSFSIILSPKQPEEFLKAIRSL
jgi:hypothetical protein